MRHELPEGLLSRTGTTERGRAFVRGSSGLVNDLAKKWRLVLEAPFPGLSRSWVAPARQTGHAGAARDVVLKVGVVCEDYRQQLLALSEFRGEGCVQLLDADAERGALLLERIRPGTPLASLEDDDRAISVALESMAKLWRPAPAAHSFRSVPHWCRSLLSHDPKREVGANGSTFSRHVERARQLLSELSLQEATPMLLHADLHQFNVLDAGGGRHVAIDPKGAVGDIGFELGPLLRNQLLTSQRPRLRLAKRVARVARELARSEQWVLRWAFVHSVLSTLWLIEDHEPGLDERLACLLLMAELLGG